MLLKAAARGYDGKVSDGVYDYGEAVGVDDSAFERFGEVSL